MALCALRRADEGYSECPALFGGSRNLCFEIRGFDDWIASAVGFSLEDVGNVRALVPENFHQSQSRLKSEIFSPSFKN